MRLGLAISIVPILLGGCLPAIPPAISLATTGFSGLVMLSTGKTTADHLISAVADEDCSMLRVVFGEEPCRAHDGDNGKSATELVAYHPGDSDDWVGQDSPPVGAVSGKTVLTTSANGTDIIEGPAESVSAMRLSDDISVEDRLDDVSSFASGGLPPIENMGVIGFAPIDSRHALEPAEPKGIVSIDDQVGMPVSSVGSGKVSPVLDLGDSKRESDGAGKDGMTVFPVSRPYGRASVRSVAAQPAEHFVMLGSFRDKNRAQRLKETTRYSGAPAPVIMSVRIEGRLWHRVAVGPFSGTDALLMASALETVSGTKPWTAKVTN